MNALVLTEPGRLEWQEAPAPTPSEGDVLLRVQLAGVCSLDLKAFRGQSRRHPYPCILGHEMVGAVAGGWGNGIAEGEWVAVDPLWRCGACANCRSGRGNLCRRARVPGMDGCPGAFAEYLCVPRTSIHPVPAGLPAEAAILLEPLACGVHLMSLARPEAMDRLAIFGVGTQGALILWLARRLGCPRIYAIDINPDRLALASKLGAAGQFDLRRPHTMEDILTATDGLGVGTAIDAAGTASARQAAARTCRDGGDVLLLGMAEAETVLDCNRLVTREVRLQFSFAYTSEDFRRAIGLLSDGCSELLRWVEVCPMDRGQAALERMAQCPGHAVKTALRP